MRNIEKTQKEKYIESLLAAESEFKSDSRFAAEKIGLDRISLSPTEGAMIRFFVSLFNCKKFVEVGTLTGLSAQYIYDGMCEAGSNLNSKTEGNEDPELWTIEKSSEHAKISRDILQKISSRIHIIEGDAQLELDRLSDLGPFDGMFIDGNKAAYGKYLDWAEKNVRSGGLIIGDNVFLSGAVWGGETTQKFNSKQIGVMKEFNQRLSDPKKYRSILVPTLEGFFVAEKLF